jgi:hypothetical protein
VSPRDRYVSDIELLEERVGDFTQLCLLEEACSFRFVLEMYEGCLAEGPNRHDAAGHMMNPGDPGQFLGGLLLVFVREG